MISTGKHKLTQDLKRIEMMVGELTARLDGKGLFWPTPYADLTTVTLGNYLMRQNRLLAVRGTALTGPAQERLDTVAACFDRLLYYNAEEFKHIIGRELEARLDQWREYVQRLPRKENRAKCYEVEGENRVIIEDIFQKLSILADQPAPHLLEEIEQLDLKLRQHWQPGKFIWPDEWQPAYPQAIYWWLYGQPQNTVKITVNRTERSTYLPQPHRKPGTGPALAVEPGRA